MPRPCRKSRSRRYATAQELADDIGRYLNHEPIVARPASTWYQITKFAKRNRLLVGSAAIVFLALVLGVVGTGLALSRALDAEADARQKEADALAAADSERALRKELQANEKSLVTAKEEAQRQHASAEAVNNFLVQMFEKADPYKTSQGARRNITVAEVLDAAAAKLDTAIFKPQPLIEATLRHVIGITYRNLGEEAKSAEQLKRELELRREHDPGDDPQALIDAYNSLAVTLYKQGQHEHSRRLYETALTYSLEKFGKTHASTLKLQGNLAAAFEQLGLNEQAQERYRDTLSAMRQHLGDRHQYTLEVLANEASRLRGQNRLEEAEAMMREVDEGLRAVLGPVHPNTLTNAANLANLLAQRGSIEEALRLTKNIWETKRQVLGEDHESTLASKASLAYQLSRTDKTDEAIEQLLDVLAHQRRVLGEAHQQSLFTLHYLLLLMPKQSRSSELEQLALDMVQAQQQRTGRDHPDTARLKIWVGRTLNKTGNPAKAETLLTEALAALPETAYPEGHPLRMDAREDLAIALRNQKRFDEAAPILRDTLRLRVKHLGNDMVETLDNYNWLGRTLLDMGDLEAAHAVLVEAMRHQRAGGKAAEKYLKVGRALTHRVLEKWLREAAAIRDKGKLAEAEQRFRAYLKHCVEAFGERHTRALHARNWLTSTLIKQGREDEALEMAIETMRMCRESHPVIDAPMKLNEPWLRQQAGQLRVKAIGLRGKGDLKGALALYRQALRVSRAAAGDTHINSLDLFNWLGRTLTELGRHEEAVEVLTEGEVAHHAAGAAGKQTLEANRFWLWTAKAGDGGRAKMLQLTRDELGEDDPLTFTVMIMRGAELIEQAKAGEATPLFREALAGRRRLLGETHPMTMDSRNWLGRCLFRAGRHQEAIDFLDEAIKKHAAGDKGAPYIKNAKLWRSRARRALAREDDPENQPKPNTDSRAGRADQPDTAGECRS